MCFPLQPWSSASVSVSDGFLHLFRIGTRACQPCDNSPPLQSSYPQNNSDTPHLHMGFGPSIPTPWVSGSSLHPTPPSPISILPPQELCSAGATDRALPPIHRACPAPSDSTSLSIVICCVAFPREMNICLSIHSREDTNDRQAQQFHPSLLQ